MVVYPCCRCATYSQQLKRCETPKHVLGDGVDLVTVQHSGRGVEGSLATVETGSHAKGEINHSLHYRYGIKKMGIRVRDRH